MRLKINKHKHKRKTINKRKQESCHIAKMTTRCALYDQTWKK